VLRSVLVARIHCGRCWNSRLEEREETLAKDERLLRWDGKGHGAEHSHFGRLLPVEYTRCTRLRTFDCGTA
jgi:hypothetical protein